MRLRRLAALALLAAGSVLAAVMLTDGERTKQNASSGSAELAPLTHSQAETSPEELATTRTDANERERRAGQDPWPGLRGDWMYRCAVDLIPHGDAAPEELRLRVDGPGLPHRGWTAAPDERGILHVPELAIGVEYSVTVIPEAWVLPGFQLDLRAHDRFHIEPYSEPDASGKRSTMRCEFSYAPMNMRVQVVDTDGILLQGLRIQVLQAEHVPAKLICGESEWTLTDGTMPLPAPFGNPETDPFLRVLTPEGEFQDLPLNQWLLAEAVRDGKLVLERHERPIRVRFEAVLLDGSPSLQSVVVTRDDQVTIALPDWSGRFDFLTRERSFLIRTPDFPDRLGLLSQLGSLQDELEEWPQVRIVQPGEIALHLAESAKPHSALVEVRVEVEGDDALDVSREFSSMYWGAGQWSARARFRAGKSLHLASLEERELKLCFYWWGHEQQVHDLILTPASMQEVVFTPPNSGHENHSIVVQDASHRPVARAQVELSFARGTLDQGTDSLRPPFLFGWTDTAGRILLPPWPDGITPWIHVRSNQGPQVSVALIELVASGGVITLAP